MIVKANIETACGCRREMVLYSLPDPLRLPLRYLSWVDDDSLNSPVREFKLVDRRYPFPDSKEWVEADYREVRG